MSALGAEVKQDVVGGLRQGGEEEGLCRELVSYHGWKPLRFGVR